MLFAEVFQFGNILLIFSFIFCISYSNKPYIGFTFISIMLMYLVYIFYIDDFKFEIVSHFSGRNISLIYKILAFYSSNEGSMLLLIWVISLYSLIFFICHKNNNIYRVKAVALNIQGFITAIFIVFEFFILNPFKRNFLFSDMGIGFNPLLHDSSYITHPPFMYFGYLSTSILYSISLALLVCKDFKKECIYILKVYGLISCFFLTLGIFLGSVWAYKELGWGGFWFWDPVENVALIPWLISIINIHLVNISIKQNLFKKILIFNYILPFHLVIFGTFITRSGIVESVHSFVFDYKLGLYLLILLLIIIGFSLLIFVLFKKNINSEIFYFFKLDKSTQISLFALCIIFISFLIVIIGVLFPVFFRIIFASDVIITEDYYNFLFNYCALIVLFANVFAIYFNDSVQLDRKNIIKTVILILSILFALLCVIYIYRIYNIKLSSLMFFYIGGVAFLFYLLLCLYKCYLYINTKVDLNLRKVSGFISHIGFAILFLGICFVCNMKVETVFELKKGESYIYNDKEIILESYTINTNNPLYDYIVANVYVYNEDHVLIDIFSPEYRLYKNPVFEKSKVFITKFFLYDIYINIIDITTNDEKGSIFHFNLLFFPFINMVWSGALLMLLGIITSLFTKRKYIKNNSIVSIL